MTKEQQAAIESEFLEEEDLYGRSYDCVAFSTHGEFTAPDGERFLHPINYCMHPENGGPKHGCDLFDEEGRLMIGKACPFRVRNGAPGASKLYKSINWKLD